MVHIDNTNLYFLIIYPSRLWLMLFLVSWHYALDVNKLIVSSCIWLLLILPLLRMRELRGLLFIGSCSRDGRVFLWWMSLSVVNRGSTTKYSLLKWLLSLVKRLRHLLLLLHCLPWVLYHLFNRLPLHPWGLYLRSINATSMHIRPLLLLRRKPLVLTAHLWF